jgi:hypothetical protein
MTLLQMLRHAETDIFQRSTRMTKCSMVIFQNPACMTKGT